MATEKFSSLLLLSMMVFALIILPIDSAVPGKLYYKCMPDGCTLTPPCAAKCESMGFQNAGECRIYSYGGVCCCQCTDKSCIN
ncbi:unnamed protein product [Brassica oleracea var. botrytis]|uniref:Knottin scorpion toxin-like domain-containing protein n=2 Tax=Brassica TaxID=3705 RepID=A0A3P6FSK5_BRAOL|nr:unnamed protein product [Brassica napus]VDD61227.1 unnamed protein product [Brassica oleracea]